MPDAEIRYADLLPFHVITIVNGNTDHYGVFPGWYSFVILPVMLAMVVVFARLRNADRQEGDHIGRSRKKGT